MNEIRVIENNQTASPLTNVNRETAELIFSSVPANTVRAYAGALRRFRAWSNDTAIDQVTDAMLADYVTHLRNEGKSPSTIQIAVSAVNYAARYAGVSMPADVATKETLRAVRVNDALTRSQGGESHRRGQVTGLTWRDVARVCGFAEASGGIAGLRDSAMIQLMSDCLLRVSEVVAVNCSHLRRSALYIPRSKTDQMGEGKSLYVTQETRRAIKKYRERAGIERGALFRRIRRGGVVTNERLTAGSARRRIKHWAEIAGFQGVSGHSMRVGSAVSLAQKQASVVEMQQAGRWKDPKMPAHYAQAEIAEQGAIAKYKEQ